MIVGYRRTSTTLQDNRLQTDKDTIEKYCEKYNIQYSSYEFESEHCDWQPGLAYYIKQKPDGIVLASM